MGAAGEAEEEEMSTRDEVQRLAMSLVPIGYLVPWVGCLDDIPGGWALADGTNGTVDAWQKGTPTFTTKEGFVFPYYPPGIYPIQKAK